jgi:hypothetical protein
VSRAEPDRRGDSVGERVDVAEASVGPLRQRRRHRRGDVRGHVRASHGERRRRLGEDARDDDLQRGRGERRLAGEHLVEDRAERVDVGARVDAALAPRLFRAPCTAACRSTGRCA